MADLVWVQARRAARDTLHNYWNGVLPVPVSRISRLIGVDPYQATLSKGVSGMIVKYPRSQPRSYASSEDPANRRRFTLAHELGHFIERTTLANDDNFSFVDMREPGRYDLHEFYADEFAGALLMPEPGFSRYFDEHGPLAAAAKYAVSLPAAMKRRERLKREADLISKGKAPAIDD